MSSGVSSAALAKAIGSSAIFCRDGEVSRVLDATARGAVILMGAGDMEDIKRDVLKGK